MYLTQCFPTLLIIYHTKYKHYKQIRFAIMKCKRRKTRIKATRDQEYRLTSRSLPVNARNEVSVTRRPPTSESTSALFHSFPARRQVQRRTESQGNRNNHSIIPHGSTERRRHTDGIQNRLQANVRLNVPSGPSDLRISDPDQTNTPQHNSEEQNDNQYCDVYVQNNPRSPNNTSSRTTPVSCIPNPAYVNNATDEQRERVTSTSYLSITNRDQTTSPLSVDTNGDHMYDYPRFETQDDGTNELDQENRWTLSQSVASDAYAN